MVVKRMMSSQSLASSFSSSSSSASTETYSYSVTRRYYTKARRVEQSIDIYEPISNRNGEQNSNSTDKDSVRIKTVLLVMGSGWVGHRWWVYAGTNWWNTSGPETIAKLGYRCISIRHSGGFLRLPNLPLITKDQQQHADPIFILVALFAMISSIPSGADDVSLSITQFWIALCFFFYFFMHWQGRGAADLNQMVQDVAAALKFIHGSVPHIDDTPVVVGGYSSGGHVLATLLSRYFDELQLGNLQTTKRGTSWIQGIMYLSGVLSMESRLIKLVAWMVFGKKSREVPSPYPFLESDSSSGRPPHDALATTPHLVIGCHHETFGLDLLNATFCAKDYVHWLQTKHNRPARCVLVDSNHWSILSSSVLREALRVELPKLWDHQERKMR